MRRRVSWPLVAILLGMLTVCVFAAVLAPRGPDGVPLSPRNASPQGSRALAQVLRQHGVEVHSDTDLATARNDLAGKRATLLITSDTGLSGHDLDGLLSMAGDDRIVVVAPSRNVRSRLFPDDTRASETGSVYPASADGRRVVINDPEVLANGTITRKEHARTAIRALGSAPDLVWISDWHGRASGAPQGLAWPRWMKPLVWSLILTTLVLVLTRVRRFGRLATEPLPVVVRAIESTRALATLYRRNSARDAAAAALVEGTSARLRRQLALPPARSAAVTAPPRDIVDAVPEPQRELAECLLAPAPHSDKELIELAERLDRLEKEITLE